jgi:hypothetical protein
MTLKTRQQIAKAIALSLGGLPLDQAEAMQMHDTANELIEMGMQATRYGQERGDEDTAEGGRRLLEVGQAMKQAITNRESKRA